MSPSAPPFGPGDPLPKISMPAADGAIVDLTHQSLAGHAVVLWFAGASLPLETARAFADMLQRFSAVEARAYAVIAGPPPSQAPAADSMPCLFDPDGRVAGGLLTGATGIAVIDPSWRVHSVSDGGDFEGALKTCAELHERSPPSVVSLQAPVLLIDGVFEPRLCRRLVSYWEAGEKSINAVASARHGTDYSGSALKKRADVLVADRGLFETLTDRFRRRIVPEVFRSFQVRISNVEPFRIGCYDAAETGEFGRHRDNTTPHTAHRQFAVSLNLNTGEYEGGHVRFPEYGRRLYAPAAGAALVFSCSLLHEALPVTLGRRMAVFGFIHDREAAERERQMLARQPGGGPPPLVLKPPSSPN